MSLTELLIVTAIIAILASLLLPAIGLVRTQARTAVCMGNLRQLGLAINAYPTDFQGFYPPALGDWNAYNGSGANRRIIWQFLAEAGLLEVHADGQLSNVRLLRCPAGQRQDLGATTVHYSATSSLLGSLAGGNQLRQSQVRSSGRTIVSADVAAANFSWWPEWYHPTARYYATAPPYVRTGWSAPHRSSTNWLLLDGHVENVAYRGGWWPMGERNCAIDDVADFVKPVNGDGDGNPAPSSGTYLWSRQQMAAAR